MSMLYIGVDIGGTATKYGVFTVEGKLISKWGGSHCAGAAWERDPAGSGRAAYVLGCVPWVCHGADCRGRRWHTWTGAE